MAHYDEKNQADFAAVTKRIEDALKQIAEDERLPATQANLAALAGVHRNTFGYKARGIYRDKLKAIKSKRKAKQKISLVPKSNTTDQVVSTQIDYQTQLRLSREQVGELTLQLSEAEAQNRDLRYKLQLAQDDRESIWRERQSMQDKLRKLSQTKSLALV